MTDTQLKLGFIGLGQMGAPLAARLAQSGQTLAVYDTNADALNAIAAEAKVIPCATVRAVVEQVDLVFTCLPHEKAIRAVYLEPDGIGDAGRPGLISCDISTATPELVRTIHAQFQAKGIDHFEAPVFGVPRNVQAGDAYFALSGNPDTKDRVAAVLASIGRGYQYVGDSGSASIMKILQNSLGYGYAILTAEILTLCSHLGADAEQFVKLVKGAGVMGLSKYFEMYAEDLVTGRPSNTGHLQIAAKDTQLLKSIMDENQFNAPVLEEAVRLFKMASDRGMGGEDFTAVSQLVAEFSKKQ